MHPATSPFSLALALVLAGGMPACKGTSEPGGKPPVDTTTTTPPTNNIKVDVLIRPDEERSPVSPLIYGSNQDYSGLSWTIRRYGGNRTTGYNWENNYSSAGSDWQQSSDDWLVSNDHIPNGRIPGVVLTTFHDRSLAMGAASIVTLQMAGYVAADAKGTVTQAETAPSPRWVRVVPKKAGPLLTTPDTTDGVVCMDELVNLFVQKYGNATSSRGVRWYSLDNEPALWPSTHPRIHPQKTGAKELVDRSVALASAVKAVDPGAGIVGPVLYGMGAYLTFQDAPDWTTVKGSYRWFIDWYLSQMKQAETTGGRRLLDALDVHWYPEALGDHRIVDDAVNTTKDDEARMQAPRTLWDSTYRENSWIAQWSSQYLPLLPTLKTSIDRYYPGTKLAITEYDYGAGDRISGGLAQADVLGAFGRYGVDVATLWGIQQSDAYAAAAFRLYRDYDGRGGQYGTTSVRANTADVANTSVWAATDDAGALHVILINKSRSDIDARVAITSAKSYSAGIAWGFDRTSAQLTQRPGVSSIKDNAFTYTVPALGAVHLVLK